MQPSFSNRDIGVIRMLTNPPTEIVNCGHKVINTSDGYIYEFIGTSWVKADRAEREDYVNIPQLIN